MTASLTEKETQRLDEKIHDFGFRNLGELLRSFSNTDSYHDFMNGCMSHKLDIRLREMSTCINLIDAGIDAEKNMHEMVERSRRLCRDFNWLQ